MDLKCEIRVGPSPYGDVVPQAMFNQLAMELIEYAGFLIEEGCERYDFPKESFGLCVLDPVSPGRWPSSECVLVTAAIGDDGRLYVANAIDKAVRSRNAGEEWGKVLYTQPHRIPGGAFRWGYAANVNGTIVGGSAQSQKQDQKVCESVATEYNYRVARAFEQWEQDHPRKKEDGTSHSWFTDSGVAPGWLQNHPMNAFDGDEGIIRLNF